MPARHIRMNKHSKVKEEAQKRKRKLNVFIFGLHTWTFGGISQSTGFLFVLNQSALTQTEESMVIPSQQESQQHT